MSDIRFDIADHQQALWSPIPGELRCVWDLGAIVAVQQAWQSNMDGAIEWRDVPSVNAAPEHSERGRP